MSATNFRTAEMARPVYRDWRLEALAAALFVAVSVASVLLTRETGRVAAIWPANALVLCALLRGRVRPWATLGLSMAGGCVANLAFGDPLSVSLLLPAANAVEIVTAFWLARRGRGEPFDLARRSDLVRLLWGGLAGSALSTAVAAGGLAMLSGAPAPATAAVWLSADALGLLIFTPLLWVLASGQAWALWSVRQRAETASLYALLAAVLAVVFVQSNYPLLFLCAPVLVLIAFRLGTAGAALALGACSVAAIASTLSGHGPMTLIHGDLTQRLLMAQVFMGATVVTVIPVAASVTERNRLSGELRQSLAAAEDARRSADESEALYRLMAENSTDIIARIDLEGVNTFISPASEMVTGWRPEALVNRNSLELLHPDDAPRVEAIYRGLLRDRRARPDHPVEYRARRPNGEYTWVEALPTVVFDAAGRPLQIVDTVRNIDDRKAYEAKLEAALLGAEAARRAADESEARYRLMADNSTDIIGCVDIAGVNTFVSPASRSVMGWEPDELVGRRAIDQIHPDDAERVSRIYGDLIRKRQARPDGPVEYRARRPDGSYVWLESRPTVLFEESGRAVQVVDVVSNISARKAKDEEILAARAEADKAAAAKGEFLATMSHELRTPLQAILGYAGLLTQYGSLTDQDRGFVQRINVAGESLLAIINDVLDFSRLENGRVELHEEGVEVSELLDSAVGMVAPTAATKGLSVTARVEGEGADALVVDVTRIRQVLLNLLSNAVKFTEHGSVTVTAAAAGPDVLRFSVADTGVGVPEAAHARLFHRFTQADSSTVRDFGGTGLGLAICKALVERMGGRIGFESQVGRGSTFWFTLPVSGAPELARAA